VDRIRNNSPVFIPAVTSTHGEFGTELIALIEWLIAKFTRKATFEGDHEDGVPLPVYRQLSETKRKQQFRWS